MKQVFFVLGMIALLGINASSQSLKGKRLLSISAGYAKDKTTDILYSGSTSSSISNNGYSVPFEISYGKVNGRNLLIGGGIGNTISFLRYYNGSTLARTGVASTLYPHLILQKFTSLGKGFYYTPSFIGGFSFTLKNIDDGVNSSANNKVAQVTKAGGALVRIRPVSFTYKTKRNFYITLILGEFSLETIGVKSTESNSTVPVTAKKHGETNGGLSLPVSFKVSFGL